MFAFSVILKSSSVGAAGIILRGLIFRNLCLSLYTVVVCMYMHEHVCASVASLPGACPSLRSWSLGGLAEARLLAAAGECQQMWIVKRCFWFISCSSTCTKHSCCPAHRAKGNMCMFCCVCTKVYDVKWSNPFKLVGTADVHVLLKWVLIEFRILTQILLSSQSKLHSILHYFCLCVAPIVSCLLDGSKL